jgi:hypothetical protein
MKFNPFVPEFNATDREHIWSQQRRGTEEEIALFLQAVAEELFIREKRPFYRLYLGITEALTRLGIEKLDVSKIHPPVNPLSLEFPADHPLIAGTRRIASILFHEFEQNDTLFIEYRSSDNAYGMFVFPRENKQITYLLTKSPEADRETYKIILQIVFGVCMIPHADTSLVTPRVLSRDKEKFGSTGDMKFVERAKRNGVNGWDVGRDIPTLEEMETFRQQQGEPGRKSPHWRTGHFAIRLTGEGRSVPVIRWIKETFVNKDLWKEVPTGYHGGETADDT